MKQILIIDDDTELCELLTKSLERENFQALAVHTGEAGLLKAISGEFDLAILDVMLPDASGFEILRRIRSASSVPVLMLTARGEEIDRVVGLEIGADDYLAKPFATRELVARLNAIFRRIGAEHETKAEPEKLTVGDLTIEIEARSANVGGKSIELSTAEFDVLVVLVRSAGRIVSRNEIAQNGLDKKLGLFDRSVDMIVSKIRRKLEKFPGGNERIRAVRGSGYIYVRQQRTNV